MVRYVSMICRYNTTNQVATVEERIAPLAEIIGRLAYWKVKPE